MNKERYFTFIMYEDSRPENWKDILQQTGLQFAISPYHDKDINPDGSKKKPHYHVLIIFSGPSTLKNANKISSSINGTICQPVKSTIGIIRYFSHKDNPEKYQYNEEEITTINGLDIKDLNGLTSTQVEVIKREIIKFIRDNEILEYRQLIDLLLDNQLYQWLEVASTKTIFFKAYLDSGRYQKKETIKNILTKK